MPVTLALLKGQLLWKAGDKAQSSLVVGLKIDRQEGKQLLPLQSVKGPWGVNGLLCFFASNHGRHVTVFSTLISHSLFLVNVFLHSAIFFHYKTLLYLSLLGWQPWECWYCLRGKWRAGVGHIKFHKILKQQGSRHLNSFVHISRNKMPYFKMFFIQLKA